MHGLARDMRVHLRLASQVLPRSQLLCLRVRPLAPLQFTDEHGEVCPANWTPGSNTMKVSVSTAPLWRWCVPSAASAGNLRSQSRTDAPFYWTCDDALLRPLLQADPKGSLEYFSKVA